MKMHSQQADRGRGGEPGSVLEAIAGLTIDVASDDDAPVERRRPSAAFLPARRPKVEPPGTGIIDVRALGIRARRPEATPAPAVRSSPTVVVSPALVRERPAAAPAVAAPVVVAPPRSSPVLAFVIGALVGTGVFAASLLLGGAT